MQIEYIRARLQTFQQEEEKKVRRKCSRHFTLYGTFTEKTYNF